MIDEKSNIFVSVFRGFLSDEVLLNRSSIKGIKGTFALSHEPLLYFSLDSRQEATPCSHTSSNGPRAIMGRVPHVVSSCWHIP